MAASNVPAAGAPKEPAAALPGPPPSGPEQLRALERAVRRNGLALFRKEREAARAAAGTGGGDGGRVVAGSAKVASWGASLILPAASPTDAGSCDDAPAKGFALWLGAADDALRFEALRERRITAIVNVALAGCLEEQSVARHLRLSGRDTADDLDSRWEHAVFQQEWYAEELKCPDFRYLAISALDMPEYPLSACFNQVCDFVCACRNEGRSVLVHCMQGINRSAAVCAAFLAREGAAGGEPGASAAEAVDWISKRRVPVLENSGFLRQLVECYGAKHAYPECVPSPPRQLNGVEGHQSSCGQTSTHADEALSGGLACGSCGGSVFALGAVVERVAGGAGLGACATPEEESPRRVSMFKATRLAG